MVRKSSPASTQTDLHHLATRTKKALHRLASTGLVCCRQSLESLHIDHLRLITKAIEWPHEELSSGLTLRRPPPPHPPSHCNTHLPYQGSDLRVEEKAFKCLWNRLANQFRYSSYLGLIQDKEDSETDGSWIKNPGCFQSPTVGIKKGKQIAITSSLVHVWYDTPLLSTNSTLTRSNVHKGLNRWLKSSESGLTNLL